MTPLFRKFLGLNWVLFFTVTVILIFGVTAVYSASSFREDEYLANSWHRQVIWIALGMVLFFGAALTDYRWIRWGAPIIYLAGIGALLAVKVMGVEQSGAKSWMQIGPLNFQPSQLAILGGILCLAVVLGDFKRVHKVFRYHFVKVALCLALVGLPMVLVLLEPDFGSASVWGPVLAAMLLVGSVPYRYLIALTLLVVIAIPLGYFFYLKPYQKSRIETHIRMLQGKKVDVQGPGWVPNHVQTAVGSAGWEGKGFLAKRVPGRRSLNRLGFIPERVAINDFIFAVILEEHGFRGGLLVVSVMAFLLIQCLFVGYYSRDDVGRLLVIGITSLLFWHMFMNMGMSANLMPITGLPLPLVSYGGTFMLTVLFLLGMVQSVWVHRSLPATKAAKEGVGKGLELSWPVPGSGG